MGDTAAPVLRLCGVTSAMGLASSSMCRTSASRLAKSWPSWGQRPGKSTLLHAAALLRRPGPGAVWIGGERATRRYHPAVAPAHGDGVSGAAPL